MYTKKSVKYKFSLIALTLVVFLASSLAAFLNTSVSAATPTAQWVDQYDLSYGSSAYGFATGWYYNSVNNTATFYTQGTQPLPSPYQYFTNNNLQGGLCNDMLLYNPATPSKATYLNTTTSSTNDVCNVVANSLVSVDITNSRPGGEPPPNGVTAQWENATELVIAVQGVTTNGIFTYTSSSSNNMTLTLASAYQSPGNTVCTTPGSIVVDNYAAKGNHTGVLTNYDVVTSTGTDTGCGSQNVPIVNAWPSGPIAGSCVLPNGDSGTIGTGGVCVADSTTTTTSTDDCPIDSSDSLRWLFCPIFDIGKTFTTALNGIMQTLLYTPTAQIFGSNQNYCTYTSTGQVQSCSSTTSFAPVFNTFRDIGLALLVIAGLVMVASQAAGLEVFAAYTVRKALPRIVIAMIGLSLAWPLLQFVVTFFDDLGVWISQLILITTHVSTGSNPSAPLIGIEIGVMGSIFAIGAGLVLGAAGIISLIGTIALALFVGFLVLTIRQLVVLVCVLVAPLAIASYVLPGTQRLWRFWSDTLIRALLMFPIIMAFLSVGAAFAGIAAAAGAAAVKAGDTGHELAWDLMALISYFAPYFLIPFAFSIAGGLLASIHSAVNGAHQGAFTRLKKQRQEIRATNMQGIKYGTRLQSTNGLAKRFNAASGFGGAFLSSQDKVGFLRNKETRDAARERHGAVAQAELMRRGDVQATQYNDDMLRAQTFESQSEAEKGLHAYFRDVKGMTDENGERTQRVNRAMAAAMDNGGFDRVRQRYAATQLAAVGTGYEDQKDLAETIARVSHGDRATISSLVGNTRGFNERAGRHDLKAEYGTMVTLAEGEAKLAGSAVPTEAMYDAATVEASLMTDNTSLVRDKKKSVENMAKALGRAAQSPIEIAVAKQALGSKESVADLTSQLQGQVLAKFDNIKAASPWAPEVNITAAAAGQREVADHLQNIRVQITPPTGVGPPPIGFGTPQPPPAPIPQPPPTQPPTRPPQPPVVLPNPPATKQTYDDISQNVIRGSTQYNPNFDPRNAPTEEDDPNK